MKGEDGLFNFLIMKMF